MCRRVIIGPRADSIARAPRALGAFPEGPSWRRSSRRASVLANRENFMFPTRYTEEEGAERAYIVQCVTCLHTRAYARRRARHASARFRSTTRLCIHIEFFLGHAPKIRSEQRCSPPLFPLTSFTGGFAKRKEEEENSPLASDVPTCRV